MTSDTTIDTESGIERVQDTDISAEMESSYLEYAYSVIYARALPDARDGLKPVQRRILYSMDSDGLRPDKPFVKCARVVGNVMGKLHPHGDAAIYDAMVRLGQPWAMRLPLIEGHGNFGSLDAGPAAPRYTECRLAPAAMAMCESLDEDTVDFRPNYDGKELEPSVLPAAFPNLLVNGGSGIAVGMATNLAPHNLGEVVAALRHLLDHPDADLDELMRYIPGPDFPSGGKIIGLDGVREAYATGRGQLRLRATARVEQVSARRRGIVITELPVMIGPERIIEQIKALVAAKKLTGIADVKDLTDLRNGLRLVVEVKNGISPEALLEQLYKTTKLEDSFAINAVALVDGQPRTLCLKDMLQVYLDHRLQVVLRRSKYQLAKAQARLHLVDGLLLAMLDIDKVIAIVRTSDEAPQAKTRLMEAFNLSDAQATYILDMQLRQLTRMSTIKLSAEREQLQARIGRLQAIIDDPTQLRSLVGEELAEVAATYGDARRTVLLQGGGVVSSAALPLEIPDGPCLVMLSSAGLLGRVDLPEGAALPAGTGQRANHDVLVSRARTTTRGLYGVITNRGRMIKNSAIGLPVVPLTAATPNLQGGVRATELIMLETGEKAVGVVPLGTNDVIALGTAGGVVKRVTPEVLGKDSWDVIRLDDGDDIVGACVPEPGDELVFVTSDAQLLHFPAALVRPQGRSGGGIVGIKLTIGAKVVWFGATDPRDALVVTVAGKGALPPANQTGTVKVTPFGEYPGKGRATAGVRCHRFLKDEDALLRAWVGQSPAGAASPAGTPIQLPPPTGRRDGSGTPLLQPVAAVASLRLG